MTMGSDFRFIDDHGSVIQFYWRPWVYISLIDHGSVILIEYVRLGLFILRSDQDQRRAHRGVYMDIFQAVLWTILFIEGYSCAYVHNYWRIV